MDIDYSPTGREFVTGSYDRTVSAWPRTESHPLKTYFLMSTKKFIILTKLFWQVRIFQYNGGHSREIYHTKRMQRLNSRVLFSSLNFFFFLVD